MTLLGAVTYRKKKYGASSYHSRSPGKQACSHANILSCCFVDLLYSMWWLSRKKSDR